MAASAPTHCLLEFFSPVLCTIYFPRHRLLSQITIVETTDSGERGMNRVKATIINPWKDYWPSPGIEPATSNSQSCMLPTELWSWPQQFNET